MRDDARRCTATSKRTGKRCRFNVFKRDDGTYTKTCHYHSGGHSLREKGDPRNGGQPPTTHLYRSGLLRPGDLEIIAEAESRIGRLDDELSLLRRNLVRYLEACEAKPLAKRDLGLEAAIVHEHVERIGKAELRRKALQENAPGAQDDAETYLAWVAARQAPSDEPSSGSAPSSAPAPAPRSTPEP